MGKKVLLVDLDPQCNLSIYCLDTERIQSIWNAEIPYIDEPGFADTRKNITPRQFDELCGSPRTIHFLLKPAEEGTGELDRSPPVLSLGSNLGLIPGRLTLHMFEEAVTRRWSEAFIGQPLALRTISDIRRIITQYSEEHGYDIAIVDTSPSLGQLNKVVLSTVDAFLVPCAPDLFSLYGIRNIGNSLGRWMAELNTFNTLIAPSRRPHMPTRFVRFLGYTVYNAKLRTGSSPWDMAIAHYNYARQIPSVVAEHMPVELSTGIEPGALEIPIGEQAVMHTHNTYPALAQKYHSPMWRLPSTTVIEPEDLATVRPNAERYLATKEAYTQFALDLIGRLTNVGLEP